LRDTPRGPVISTLRYITLGRVLLLAEVGLKFQGVQDGRNFLLGFSAVGSEHVIALFVFLGFVPFAFLDASLAILFSERPFFKSKVIVVEADFSALRTRLSERPSSPLDRPWKSSETPEL
jgi:hypothetical protein